MNVSDCFIVLIQHLILSLKKCKKLIRHKFVDNTMITSLTRFICLVVHRSEQCFGSCPHFSCTPESCRELCVPSPDRSFQEGGLRADP